jgi:putative phosphoribosyl transferase
LLARAARGEFTKVELECDVMIDCDKHTLNGSLRVPDHASAMVVFAHGSGSGRLSPRNRYVARVLSDAGIATLLVDLLDEEEANYRTSVFDINLLAGRLRSIRQWLGRRSETAGLHVGYFGASTGAGAAIVAAADGNGSVGAIVSRGGRPDLAGDALGRVDAPCLLVVGSEDTQVLELNRAAFERMKCLRRLIIIPHATHLFPEPGALEEIARLARDWFMEYLTLPCRSKSIAD